MNDRFREILDSLPSAAPRSRLEPYKELIHELRQRKRTYREIARILADQCGVRVSQSTLYEFVQRYLAEESVAVASSESRGGDNRTMKSLTIGGAQSEIRRRIDTLKAKVGRGAEPVTEFQFDGSEPLRLKQEQG